MEVHKKFALPSAGLVFGLVGLPLGIVTRRGGRAAGFAVSVAIVLVYYVLLATGEARAIEGDVSPALAMWLPDILLTILGVAALVRVRKDRPLFPSISLRRGQGAGPLRPVREERARARRGGASRPSAVRGVSATSSTATSRGGSFASSPSSSPRSSPSTS